ncbi:MAG TPA: archaeal heat shock protein Hsp20 [Ktedonobacteraceae bacterium]|jgi:HSP20 family protein
MATKKDEERVDVDLGIGKISFSGIFQGIGGLIDLVSRLEEEGKETASREREFTSPSGRVRAVYGLSVKRGIGGSATIEPFGNVRETPKGPVVKEEREPLVDIFDEKDHVLVIIELPGVEQEEINTRIEGGTLILSAAGGERKYRKDVNLPEDIDVQSLQSSYKNGILELRFNKRRAAV